MTNERIAQELRAEAAQLAESGANLFRIRAYRAAALAVLGLPEPVAYLAAAGRLSAIPGIGRNLAEHIAQLAQRNDAAPLAS